MISLNIHFFGTSTSFGKPKKKKHHKIAYKYFKNLNYSVLDMTSVLNKAVFLSIIVGAFSFIIFV